MPYDFQVGSVWWHHDPKTGNWLLSAWQNMPSPAFVVATSLGIGLGITAALALAAFGFFRGLGGVLAGFARDWPPASAPEREAEGGTVTPAIQQTLYIDHGIVAHEASWPMLETILSFGKLRLALSLWNLIEIGNRQGTAGAPVDLPRKIQPSLDRSARPNSEARSATLPLESLLRRCATGTSNIHPASLNRGIVLRGSQGSDWSEAQPMDCGYRSREQRVDLGQRRLTALSAHEEPRSIGRDRDRILVRLAPWTPGEAAISAVPCRVHVAWSSRYTL